MYETASNSTSLKFSDLTEGGAYFFTVAGVDTRETIGEESLPSKVVTFKGKLTYFQFGEMVRKLWNVVNCECWWPEKDLFLTVGLISSWV